MPSKRRNESGYRRRMNARPDPWQKSFAQRHAEIEAHQGAQAEQGQRPAASADEQPAANERREDGGQPSGDQP